MSTDARLIAVILAAGASTRMGRSKAALRLGDTSFLGHALRLARRACPAPSSVFVIEGARPLEALLASADASPTHRLTNPDWSRGPLSSLQLALQHPQGRDHSVLVLTVDRPHLQPETIDALVAAWRNSPNEIWQPRFEGQRGHPVLWPRDLATRLAALEPMSSPRALMASPEVQARRAFIDVDDATILDNIDAPADLARLRALTP